MQRLLIPVALLCCALTHGAELKSERTVRANVITSERDPRMRLTLPETVQYVGTERWPLYDVADCEVHVFLEADATKRVERFYWIQFEAFLPEKPDSRYGYPFKETTVIGPWTFDTRARFGPTDDAVRAGSDAEHVRAMIRAKGYTLPPGMMNVRFVHLLDEARRKELMVIYAEDLAPTGATVTDLMPGGAAESRWAEMQKALIARAASKLRFEER